MMVSATTRIKPTLRHHHHTSTLRQVAISLLLTLQCFIDRKTADAFSTFPTTVVVDPIVVHFGIGAVAGGIGAIAAYPCDFLTSQLQKPNTDTSQYYENGWDCLVSTLQEHGPLRLYKGVGIQVLGIAPEKGIKLGVNDMLTAQFVQALGGLPLWAQIVSGGVAGACQVVASSPLEVMKVGLVTSNRNLQEVWHEVGGFTGLFRAAEACIARDVLFTSICLPFYTTLVHNNNVNPFVAGALSGVISSFAATPPDVIKTRILCQEEYPLKQQQQQQQRIPVLEFTATTAYYYGSSKASSLFDSTTVAINKATAFLDLPFADRSFINNNNNHDNNKPEQRNSRTNVWQMLQQIWTEEGPSVLFSGVSERCIGAIPRFGTTLAMHDVLEQWAHQAGWLVQ